MLRADSDSDGHFAVGSRGEVCATAGTTWRQKVPGTAWEAARKPLWLELRILAEK